MTPFRIGPAVVVLLAAFAAAGCATAIGDGSHALRDGRYAEAATHFEEALAKVPDSAAALLGLGIARYKAGDLDGAIEPLARVIGREPRSTTARLYLALVYLRKGELAPVDEHLTVYVRERPGTRLAAQADRALQILRGPDPLSPDMRAFVAASLEDEAEMELEVAEARRYAREAQFFWRDRSIYDPYYVRPYYRVRRW